MEDNNKPNNSCDCNCFGCVGYAYVPIQTMGDTYCPEDGLKNGTIFPELDLDICEYGKICKQKGMACKQMGGRM